MKNKENQKTEEKEFRISFPQRSFYSALVFVIIVAVTIFASIKFFIPEYTELFSKDKEDLIWRDFFLVLFSAPFAYAFVATGICFFVRIFKRLKSYKEGGLIFYLIFYLILGLIGGLIGGLILGLIWA